MWGRGVNIISCVCLPLSQVTLTGTARQQGGRMFSQTSPARVGRTRARTRYYTCVCCRVVAVKVRAVFHQDTNEF